MPSKYLIHTHEVPNRFRAITRSGVIVCAEKCMGCVTCVKKRCVYGVYQKRGLDPRQMLDSVDTLCKGCFRCVQGCPRELYQKSINPEYLSLGDAYWNPDIITRLWYQAETGKIPVSGAGYSGPFTGPGFDSMWTDMSEIVRPTRDGIHGREYISTAVSLGRKPDHLRFTETGELEEPFSAQLDIPIPILFQLGPFGYYSREALLGVAGAASRLGTVLVLPVTSITGSLKEMTDTVAPRFGHGADAVAFVRDTPGVRLVELQYSSSVIPEIKLIKKLMPGLVASVLLPLDEEITRPVLDIVEAGADVIHLAADMHGQEQASSSRFIKDVIRDVHMTLVEKGIRDQVTLLASGGFAMAEHVAKGILCGIDAVAIDLPLLIALGCRVCRRCTKGIPCPVEIDSAPTEWVRDRIINLIGAWHNQILEVMGAMGMREIQRLRGEIGRAMFFEDLDKEIFGSLGTWEEGYELG